MCGQVLRSSATGPRIRKVSRLGGVIVCGMVAYDHIFPVYINGELIGGLDILKEMVRISSGGGVESLKSGH